MALHQSEDVEARSPQGTGVSWVRRALLAGALLAFSSILSPGILAMILTRDGAFDGGFDPTNAARAAQLALVALAAGAAFPGVPLVLRKACEKSVLVACSLLLVLGVASLILPFVLPTLPIGLQGFVPEPFDVVAQSSKRSLLPVRYAAIVGDSYAYGMGDWRMGIRHWSRDNWQASHLLHNRTGIDVLAFGRPGRSSIGAYVNEPIRALRTLRHRFPIEDPTWILAYFYEGNDLSENLRELEERHYAGSLDPASFKRFLEQEVLPEERYEAQTARFLGLRFIARLLRDAGHASANGVREWGNDLRSTEPAANRARIGARDVLIPVGNQAAPVDIVGPDLDRALEVFRLSLEYMVFRFPRARVAVVYIPAPLSIYQLGDHLTIESKKGPPLETSFHEVLEASDRVAQRIRDICGSNRLPFIDTRTSLRMTARNEALHGPLDWRHFNRRGYEALTDAILAEARMVGLPVRDPGKAASSRRGPSPGML